MKGKMLFALTAAVLMVVFALALVGSGPTVVEAGNPDPQNWGRVYGWATYTFLPETNITTTGTYSTGCPYYRAGTNVCIANAYAQADVFVTANVSGTGVVTITPQVSADGTSWVDVPYQYTANNVDTTSVTVSQAITSTSELTTTTTTTTSSTSALAYGTYTLVMNADGTQMMRIPLYGEYLRFKYETSTMSVPTDTIPSLQIKATYKNFQ